MKFTDSKTNITINFHVVGYEYYNLKNEEPSYCRGGNGWVDVLFEYIDPANQIVWHSLSGCFTSQELRIMADDFYYAATKLQVGQQVFTGTIEQSPLITITRVDKDAFRVELSVICEHSGRMQGCPYLWEITEENVTAKTLRTCGREWRLAYKTFPIAHRDRYYD